MKAGAARKGAALMDTARRIIRLASYTIARGTLHVTLTHDASRRWGAHQPDGIDSSDCAKYRRDVRQILREKAESEGATQIVIDAQRRGAQPWTVDVVDLAA